MQSRKQYVWLIVFVFLMATQITTIANARNIVPQALPADYPPNPTQDIQWSAGLSSVDDIQAAFNHARSAEDAQLGISLPMLAMPGQQEWEGYSDGKKALWLINQERIARGVLPLHGVERNVTDVAQYYAEYLLVSETTGHTADGKSPWHRLDENAAIGACQEFISQPENLAYFLATYPIPLPVEQAVYLWMYEDGDCCGWGHRTAILQYPLNDNSGVGGKEGFLGIGRASGPINYQGMDWPYSEVVVMNVFDPCADWTYEPEPRNRTDENVKNYLPSVLR